MGAGSRGGKAQRMGKSQLFGFRLGQSLWQHHISHIGMRVPGEQGDLAVLILGTQDPDLPCVLQMWMSVTLETCVTMACVPTRRAPSSASAFPATICPGTGAAVRVRGDLT